VSAIPQRESQLHVVVDADGKTVSFGARQARWLLQTGRVVPLGEQDGKNLYRAVDPPTALAVHALVLEQPELRECDFCRAVPTYWRVHHRPFDLTQGPLAGRIERPMFACDVCARYIRSNDKKGLVEYVIASTVEYARAQGGYLGLVAETQPWWRVKEALTPMVREVVYGMFGHRTGPPERIETGA
jgi:hypothetical protein